MKDSQRERVYSWEGDFKDWNRHTASLKEIRICVRWACRFYGLKSPRISSHRSRAYSYCAGSKISFRYDQMNYAIALHETAHYISDQIFGDEIADHAPEWMGIYLWLLEGYRIAPRLALHASARARGIRWLPTWTVSPKRLARRRVKSQGS